MGGGVSSHKKRKEEVSCYVVNEESTACASFLREGMSNSKDVG